MTTKSSEVKNPKMTKIRKNGYTQLAMSERNSKIRELERAVAAQRTQDIARVRSGGASAQQVGRENGSFGIAFASGRQINLHRAARSF